MLKLGVTGSIGSGKSVVCRILECMGIPVFRADDESKRLLAEKRAIQQQVVELFGIEIITNGKPDSKKIAAIAFANPDKLTALNGIIHPAVRNSFGRWCNEYKKSEFIVEEAAILFESGAAQFLDRILLITAPPELRIRRVMQRDNLSEEDVKSREQYQWSDEEKIKDADFVLTNDGKTMLTPQVLDVLNKLRAENRKINC